MRRAACVGVGKGPFSFLKERDLLAELFDRSDRIWPLEMSHKYPNNLLEFLYFVKIIEDAVLP